MSGHKKCDISQLEIHTNLFYMQTKVFCFQINLDFDDIDIVINIFNRFSYLQSIRLKIIYQFEKILKIYKQLYVILINKMCNKLL